MIRTVLREAGALAAIGFLILVIGGYAVGFGGGL